MDKRFLERLLLQEGLTYPLAKIWDKVSFHLFYKYYYKRIFCSYGTDVRWGKNLWRLVIPKSIRIACPEKISIGDGCQIDEGVFLQCHEKGEGITLGKGSRINSHTHLLAFDKIELGERVLIAPFCLLTSGNHGLKLKELSIMDQPHERGGAISIGQGTWLGQNVKILGGVQIGRNSLVAAGAVVTQSFSDHSKIAGVPAKEIGKVGA